MYSIIFSTLVGAAIMIAAAMFFFKWGTKSLFVMTLFVLIGFYIYRFDAEFFPLVLVATVIGVLSAFALKYNKSFQFYLLAASIAACAILTTNFYFLKFFKGIDLYEQSRTQFMEYINNSDIPSEKKAELQSSFETAGVLIKAIIPFSYFLNAILFAAIGFSIVRFFISTFFARDIKISKGIEFFRLNDYLIYCFIGGWLGTLLVDAVSYPRIHAICLNTALIFSILYTIQAIGIIKYFAQKKGFSLKLLFAFIVVVVLFFSEVIVFLLVILTSLGAIDFWADFRKLERQENSND